MSGVGDVQQVRPDKNIIMWSECSLKAGITSQTLVFYLKVSKKWGKVRSNWTETLLLLLLLFFSMK